MNKRYPVMMVLLLFLMCLPAQAQGGSVHLRFFESVDTNLEADQYETFTISVLQGEQLTLAVHSLQAETVPELTVLDPLGSTVEEELNRSDEQAVFIRWTAQYNGMYTVLVNNTGNSSGVLRVMLFEGDPIDYDITLRDTLDPFAPSRAFMIGGNPDNPLNMSVDVLEPEDETIFIPDVFASRGRAETLPPDEERVTPIPNGERKSWRNADETEFYTINVRPFAEIVKEQSRWQAFEVFEYLLIIGDGSEPETVVNRARCIVNGFEVVGLVSNGQIVQIVDESTEQGYLLLDAAAIGFEPGAPGCERVVDVTIPQETGSNPGSGNGNNPDNGGGGSWSFPLFPAGNPEPLEPDPDDIVVNGFTPPSLDPDLAVNVDIQGCGGVPPDGYVYVTNVGGALLQGVTVLINESGGFAPGTTTVSKGAVTPTAFGKLWTVGDLAPGETAVYFHDFGFGGGGVGTNANGAASNDANPANNSDSMNVFSC